MPTKIQLAPYTFQTGVNGSVANTTLQFQKSRTSVGCKDWYSKIASGSDATTSLSAYDRYKVTHKTSKLVLTKVDKSSKGTSIQSAYSVIPAMFPLSDPLVIEAKSKAYGELNSKAAEIYSEFSGQIFAGELRETVDFLKDPLESLKNLTHTLLSGLIEIKKHPYKAAKDTAKAVADVWLAYRFGVLTLASDVEQICDIIADTSKQNVPNRMRAFGQAESATTTVDNNWGTGLNLSSWRHELISTKRSKCILHCGILMDHKLEQFSQFDGALKRALSLEELPTTIWNIIPLSFVIDYFANVGSIIEAATQSNVHFVYISETVIRESEARAVLDFPRILSPSATWPIIESYQPGISHFVHRSVDRTARTSAIPPLSVSLPGRNIPKLNIAALLTKLLS